jgi:hypothetical protein
MKPFSILVFLLIISELYAEAQSPKNMPQYISSGQSSIYVSTYNHAERIYKGTMYYVICDNHLQVLNLHLFDTVARVVFFKSLTNLEETNIENSIRKLDTLNNFYFNACIMILSGQEYTIEYNIGSFSKTVSLHHYYLEQIEELVDLINKSLPEKYKLSYLLRDTKQDCSLNSLK